MKGILGIFQQWLKLSAKDPYDTRDSKGPFGLMWISDGGISHKLYDGNIPKLDLIVHMDLEIEFGNFIMIDLKWLFMWVNWNPWC